MSIKQQRRGTIAASRPAAVTAFYVVREEDGTSKLTLEEGGGSIKTEEST